MSLQYRIAPEGQVRDVDEGKRRVLVSIPFETIDSYNTDFARDCFDEFLAQRLPVACWQHQRAEPIGRAVTHQRTGTANDFELEFSDFDAVPRSRQAFSQMRDGHITDVSFGFDQAKSIPHPNTRGAIRFIKGRMPEISPVTIGAIPGAVAVGIRAEAEVANVRGLLDAGAIDEDGANEMLRAAGLDPLPRQRVEIEPDPLGEAVRAALAKHGERDLVITIGSDGAVTTGIPADEPDDGYEDGSPEALAQQLDDYCDAADNALAGFDATSLPANVQEALHAYGAASVVADELLNALGVPDDDSTDTAGQNAAPDGDERATLSTADLNSKPDDDFAYIEPGGMKDGSGLTVPRDKRHFYIGDAEHVRNALARIGQGAQFSDEALPAVKAAAKKFGIDVADDSKRATEDVTVETQVALARMSLGRH